MLDPRREREPKDRQEGESCGVCRFIRISKISITTHHSNMIGREGYCLTIYCHRHCPAVTYFGDWCADYRSEDT